MVKPAYGQPVGKRVYDATLGFFDSLLKLMHPFMPFITEELWQNLEMRRDGESIMYAALPDGGNSGNEAGIMTEMDCAKEIIVGVRSVRAQKNLPNKERLTLNVVDGAAPSADMQALISKMANLEAINAGAAKDAAAASFMVGTQQYDVPLQGNIDVEAEKERIKKDIDYYEGFLASVMKKLQTSVSCRRLLPQSSRVNGVNRPMQNRNSKHSELRWLHCRERLRGFSS